MLGSPENKHTHLRVPFKLPAADRSSFPAPTQQLAFGRGRLLCLSLLAKTEIVHLLVDVLAKWCDLKDKDWCPKNMFEASPTCVPSQGSGKPC